MQAIAPVVAALNASGIAELHTCGTRESWPVIDQLCLPAVRLDEAAFAADPHACLRSVLDTFKPDLVLSGSSPARGHAPETPEQFAILESRRRGISSVAVLDYWGMYLERFSRDGRLLDVDLLPDRLCVLDRQSWSELRTMGVAPERMSITHNPWLDRLVAQSSVSHTRIQESPVPGITVVLASQPLAEMRHMRHWPYDQYDLFEQLLHAMGGLAGHGRAATLQVLVHPSENVIRWRALLAPRGHGGVQVELCQGDVHERLRQADLFVTSHSTLAYEALYFGTPCLSLRPTGRNTMSLWIEEAGLARLFQETETLRHYLEKVDLAEERLRIQKLREELTVAGMFFSDGSATERVMQEVLRLLQEAYVKGSP